LIGTLCKCIVGCKEVSVIGMTVGMSLIRT